MKNLNRIFICLLPGLIAAWLWILLPAGGPASAAQAANLIQVTTTQDELNSDGDCSLREAIQAANTNAAVDACPAGSPAQFDQINLEALTYTLSLPGLNEDFNQSGDLDVSYGGLLRIQGAGAGSTTIDAGGIDRALDIWPDAQVSLEGLALTGGDLLNSNMKQGAGIYAHSGVLLTITHSLLHDNQAGDVTSGMNYAYAGRGGAIYADNPLAVTIQDSLLLHNHGGDDARPVQSNKVEGGSGGAVYVEGGRLDVLRTQWISNTAGEGMYGGDGGAIFTQNSIVHIEASDLLSNAAGAGNVLTGSWDAHAGSGGGIYNDGSPISVIASTLRGNRAGDSQNAGTVGNSVYGSRGGNGGAIYSHSSGQFLIQDSLIEKNHTGSARVLPDAYMYTQAGNGGGIFAELYNSNALVQNSIIRHNQTGSAQGGTRTACGGAGGGIRLITHTDVHFLIQDSQIEDNRTGDGNGSGTEGRGGSGGGIAAGVLTNCPYVGLKQPEQPQFDSDLLTLSNVSLRSNHAGSGTYNGGSGGGLLAMDIPLLILDSHINDNRAGDSGTAQFPNGRYGGSGGGVVAKYSFVMSDVVQVYSSTINYNHAGSVSSPSNTGSGGGGAGGMLFVMEGGTGLTDGGFGGALYLHYGLTPARAVVTITHSSFISNTAGSVASAASQESRGGDGGAIWGILSEMIVSHSLFTGNAAGDSHQSGLQRSWGGDGGAIYTASPLTLTHSIFQNNHAGNASTNGNPAIGGSGGALHNAGGTSYMDDCLFEENQAGSSSVLAGGSGAAAGSGGAVYATTHGANAVFSLSNSIVRNNQAGMASGSQYLSGGQGGGLLLYVTGDKPAYIWDSLFEGNQAGTASGAADSQQVYGGDGGGISILRAGGGVHMNRLTITANNAGSAFNGTAQVYGGSGGGIAVAGVRDTPIYIQESTLSANQAGDATASPGASSVQGGSGGGIYNTRGETRMINSTLSGNAAGDSNFQGGSGGGAANLKINTEFTQLYLYHTTVADNQAGSGSLAGGQGGGVYNGEGADLILGNSLLAFNTSAAGSGPECYGMPISADYNLLRDITGCGFIADLHDQTGGGGDPLLDPLISPLGDYGGASATHALQSGSPAIDAIPNGSAGCSSTYTRDQRGFVRPRDGDGNGSFACDNGAYEAGLGSSLLLTDAPDPSQAGEPFTASFTVTAASTASPTGIVTVTVDGSAAAPGLSCAATLAGGSGQCTLQIDAPGIYTLTAVYSGDAAHDPSTSSQPHVVGQAQAGLSFSITPAPSFSGQTFTAGVRVAPDYSAALASSATLTPSGMVTISIPLIGSNNLSCAAQLVNGAGACIFSLDLPATYVLIASYGGDANFTPNHAFTQHEVLPGAASIEIAAAPSPGAPGEPFTVSISVASTYQTALIPSGTVSIAVPGATAGCLISLAGDGARSCTLTLQETGSYTLAAAYSGDLYFTTSQAFTQHEVLPGAASIEIAAAPSPGAPGEPFTVSVSVAPTYQTALIPGGTVSITVPGATASCLISLAGDGAGNCMLTLQEAGSYTLAAAYSGDLYFTASQASLVYSVRDPYPKFELYLPLLSKGSTP